MMKNEKEIRYFSMFTGVGGFELGLERACSFSKRNQPNDNSNKYEQERTRTTCVGFSEIDKYANELLKQKFPNIKNYGDATKINPNELPDFDMLCGGFPCQAFSIAGKRRGFQDTRGTLFFDIARILEVKRPKIVFLENVKGLLNHEKGQTFRVILQTLEELGYEIQWMVLNSKFFGVPQNRERVFIIGSLRGEPRPKILPFREDDARIDEGNEETPQAQIAPTIDRRVGSSTHRSPYIQQLNQPTHSNNRIYGEEGISPALNTAQGGNRQPKIKAVLTPDRENKRQNGRQGSSKEYIKSLKKINEAESQGMRVYDTEGVSSTIAGNAGGLGGKTGLYAVLTPDRENKRQNGRRMKEEGEPSFTLTGQDIHGVAIMDLYNNKEHTDRSPTLTEPHHNTLRVREGMKIRRLTPRECNFLQGFPKDWDRWGISFINLETYNKGNGNAEKTNTNKILSTLQETIKEGEIQERRIDELITLLKKEILQPRMYAREFQRKMEGESIKTTRKLSCKTIDYCDELLNLWETEKLRYSSQRQEQIEQLIGKLTSSLQKLSYKVTSEGGWLEQAQSFKEGERFFGKIRLMSDTQRYKMMGNAVTVNVIRTIAQKLNSTKSKQEVKNEHNNIGTKGKGLRTKATKNS